MKRLNPANRPFLALAFGLLGILLNGGCAKDPDLLPDLAYAQPGAAQPPGPQAVPEGLAPINTAGTNAAPPSGTAPLPVLRIGDLVILNFYDLPAGNPLPEYRERVRDDGTVALPWNKLVMAAGKTLAQLADDIQKAYVPELYTRMTVSVKTEERFYFVGGEVKVPNRQVYWGEMTVLRAIDTAGGFTEFANRKNIELRKANGQKFKIHWYKALQNPKLDLPVYPNDQVIVHKRKI